MHFTVGQSLVSVAFVLVDAFNRTLRASGELVTVNGLEPRARSVRMGADAPVVTDGPYLETKEYVGSYFIVDVDSEKRALEIARSYPALRRAAAGAWSCGR